MNIKHMIDYVSGVSRVDNVANPNSALNKQKRAAQLNARPDPSAHNDAVRRGIQKAYGPNSRVKRFGTPR